MPNSTQSEKWALLIGINEYPNLTKFEQLDGCVNDVRMMEVVLRETFGFPEDHIQTLTDSEATRHGILSAMDALENATGERNSTVLLVLIYNLLGCPLERARDYTIAPVENAEKDRGMFEEGSRKLWFLENKLSPVHWSAGRG